MATFLPPARFPWAFSHSQSRISNNGPGYSGQCPAFSYQENWWVKYSLHRHLLNLDPIKLHHCFFNHSLTRSLTMVYVVVSIHLFTYLLNIMAYPLVLLWLSTHKLCSTVHNRFTADHWMYTVNQEFKDYKSYPSLRSIFVLISMCFIHCKFYQYSWFCDPISDCCTGIFM